MSDWIGLPEVITEEHHSFVYMITNLITNEKYIGRKNLWVCQKKPPIKGKTRKRKVIKPSDYQKYYGSSEKFKLDVIKYGKENFKREVLEVTSCLWESGFVELMYQLKHGALMSDEFLNGIIHIRLNGPPAHLKDKYKNFWVDFGFNRDNKES